MRTAVATDTCDSCGAVSVRQMRCDDRGNWRARVKSGWRYSESTDGLLCKDCSEREYDIAESAWTAERR